MPIDDRTTNRSYQLPNADNQLADDVARLRAALQSIDADIFARYTKAETDALINNLIAAAPGALNTLQELAAAMGNDPNFAATVTTLLGQKANIVDVYSKAQSDARYVQGQVQIEMVFEATAGQSEFSLSTPVINKPSALVSVDGVVQPTSEYSLSMDGATLTLSEGVPAETKVRVLAMGVASQGAPADDTVTTPKLRDGAVTPAKLAQPFTRSLETNAAGTSVIFTGIPDWAKRITLVFNAVSTNGTSPVVIKLGNNTEDAFGYASGYSLVPNSSDGPVRSERGGNTSGIYVSGNNAGVDSRYGSVTIHDTGSRAWIASGVVGTSIFDNVSMVWGAVRLTAALDRVRITTINGTDVFDFGTITLFYE